MKGPKVVEVDGVLLCRPTRDEVENLAVGDMVLEVFGRLMEVVSIHHRGPDIHGKLFVCFYVKSGTATGTMSGSMKEGEPVVTLPAGSKWKRWENYPV